jgi:transcriptional regulator
MRRTAPYVSLDREEVKRLIRENPWATVVSNTSAGLVASHYPMVLEERAGVDGNESSDEIVLVSHVGRPDEQHLELGQHEVIVIIQGPHGYVSPGWYDASKQAVPTWNHVTAHLYGTPEILSDEENWRVLGDLVDHFEDRMPHPRPLADNEEYGRRIFGETVGFRIVITRFQARRKLSQDKPEHIVENVIQQLDHGDVYSQPALAEEMRRAREQGLQGERESLAEQPLL